MRKWDFYTTKEIKPKGWIKRQLEVQAKGLSGNLDKMYPDVRDSAWIGGDREGWERVPYWLDGFVPLAYLLEDQDMIARAKRYMDAILAAQQEDGWICPCKKEERAAYDSWAVQLISKVMTVYYECSGDERIPESLYRVLRNYYDLLASGEIRLFGWGEYRWFETLIAIRFLHKTYKEDWLLELAAILKEQGINFTDNEKYWKIPLYKVILPTHIVGITMMLKWEALGCELLGGDYKDLAEEYYSILSAYNGTPVELFTGDEHLAGLSPIHGTELCAVVEQMYSYEHLFACTGDHKWAERLEVIAFNALPAAISEDMWAHQYDQLSNQIACITFPGKAIFGTNHPNAHIFGLEPSCGCCTANFNQGWPKLTLFAFLHRGNRILNSLMIPAELKTQDVEITLETDYPFQNTANYTIRSKKDFVFEIRIPSFAENLKVNGKKECSRDLSFEIQANTETEISLSFETRPYFKERPHKLYTVQCGSLVFSVPVRYEAQMLEYVDKGVERKFPYCDYHYVPTSDWNYAYAKANLSVESGNISDIPYSMENPPVVVKAKVRKIDWGYEPGYDTVCAKTPYSRVPLTDAEEMTLIPYGCAKLRMTELPLIKAK